MALPEFPELLRTHAGLIHKVARAYCRDATDREDVTQEICTQLWRSRDRFDDRQRLSTWVYRVALNVAISFHRRERRHRGERVPVDGLLAPELGPDDDRLALLWSCLEELGALDKALVLLWLDGNDHATTAAVLGITVTNVGTRLGRAKDQLRAAYAAHTPNAESPQPKGEVRSTEPEVADARRAGEPKTVAARGGLRHSRPNDTANDDAR